MLVSGALALALAEYIGWRSTYLLMAGLIAIGLFGAWFGEEPMMRRKTSTHYFTRGSL